MSIGWLIIGLLAAKPTGPFLIASTPSLRIPEPVSFEKHKIFLPQ
jgi:hypothetical protein